MITRFIEYFRRRRIAKLERELARLEARQETLFCIYIPGEAPHCKPRYVTDQILDNKGRIAEIRKEIYQRREGVI